MASDLTNQIFISFPPFLFGTHLAMKNLFNKRNCGKLLVGFIIANNVSQLHFIGYHTPLLKVGFPPHAAGNQPIIQYDAVEWFGIESLFELDLNAGSECIPYGPLWRRTQES